VDAVREDLGARRLQRPIEGRDAGISHQLVRENRRKRSAIRHQEMHAGHRTGYDDLYSPKIYSR